jgi:hypothetical protein
MNIEQLSLSQVQDILVNKFGYSAEFVENKKRHELQLELARCYYRSEDEDDEDSEEDEVQGSDENPFLNVKEQVNSTSETVGNIINAPNVGDVNWQTYVLSLLREDEVFKKGEKIFPKTFGLRRIANQLIGPIIQSGVKQVITPSIQPCIDRITVVYEMDFDVGDGRVMTVSDVSDAAPLNTPDPYSKHLAATASTKAQGRCLKNALMINVHTAEEMINESTPTEVVEQLSDGSFQEDKEILPSQKQSITKLCTKLKIDKEKFIELNHPGKLMEDLTSAQASKLCATLNKYQAKGKDKLEIPDEIKNG